MDDTLRRKIIEWLAVAGTRPRRMGRFGSRRRRGRVRQRFGGQQIAAAARTAGMPAAPNLGGPVGGAPGTVELGMRGHPHRRADRLEAEFLLAPPAHLDRLAGPAERDDR